MSRPSLLRRLSQGRATRIDQAEAGAIGGLACAFIFCVYSEAGRGGYRPTTALAPWQGALFVGGICAAFGAIAGWRAAVNPPDDTPQGP